MIRGGKHMLEFVAYKRKLDDKWAIPGSMGSEHIHAVLDRLFPEEFDRTRQEVFKYIKDVGTEHNLVRFEGRVIWLYYTDIYIHTHTHTHTLSLSLSLSLSLFLCFFLFLSLHLCISLSLSIFAGICA